MFKIMKGLEVVEWKKNLNIKETILMFKMVLKQV